MTTYCPRCGSLNQTDALFCGACGAALTPANRMTRTAPEQGMARALLRVLAAVVAILLLVGIGLGALVATRGGSPRVRETGAPLRYATPVAALPAVTGATPSLVTVSNTWQSYRNAQVGLTLRYPPGWIALEPPEGSGVQLYPPGADPNFPSSTISFLFADALPYNPQSLPPRATPPQPIVVSGITGRRYEDTTLALPAQGVHIELPYRGGTLLIGAPTGPEANLAPQLDEVLKTVSLQP